MKKSAFLLLCLWTFNANATSILYDISNISGNQWEYSYEINNNSLAGDIEEFSIFFDFNLYENLVVGSTPADWDPLVIQPDLILPGFYDSLALVAGITPGNTLGGLSVTFDYLGTGTPGSQPFDIIDPFTFATLDSGSTSRPASQVPEPSLLLLFAVGLIVLLNKKEKLFSEFS